MTRWFNLRQKAISLRKKGISIVKIEKSLGIPRSTLSGWFREINLTAKQKNRLERNKIIALKKARPLAVIWHNKQKIHRLNIAKNEANQLVNKIRNNNSIIELSLALLYLGEGFKNSSRTGMGNSNPLILKFFLTVMTKVFMLDVNKIGFELHLRADQNPDKMKRYWSKQLKAPLSRFTKTSIDNRTEGKPTFPHYKGVCVINCSNVAIQRKLVYIGEKYCTDVIKNLRG